MTQTEKNLKPVVADYGPGHPFTGAPIICSYSRREALDDGTLVDLTFLAQNRGFRFEVACTMRAHELLVTAGIDPEETGQQAVFERREAQMLNCLLMAIKALGKERAEYVTFTALTDAGSSKAWAKCHPDDDGDACITIMLVGED